MSASALAQSGTVTAGRISSSMSGVAEGAVPLGAVLAAAAEIRQLPHQLTGAVRQGEDRAHHLNGGHLAF